MANDPIHATLCNSNTIYHITSIPPEVLTIIFMQVKAMNEIENLDKKQLEWIQVTHVCRYWRDVGIQAQCLWTNIPLYSAQWTEKMLERSKDMPITVTVDHPYSSYPFSSNKEAITKVLQQHSRFRELNVLKATCEEIEEFVDLRPSNRHISRLHTVRLVGSPCHIDDIFCVEEDTFFPNLDLSSLRRLSFTKCHLRWETAPSFLHNLTHIRVVSDYLNEFLDEGVLPFFDALRHMSALESLDFEYLTRYLRGDNPQISPLPVSFQKVSLRNLKMLRLSVHMCQLKPILEGLDIPFDVSMKFYCYDSVVSTSTFPEILSPCTLHLRNGGIPIRSFALLNQGKQEFGIRIWTTVLSLESLDGMDTPPRIDAVFKWYQPIEFTTDVFFQHTLCSMDFEHLESLAVLGQEPIESASWIRMFGTLLKLSSVYLDTSVKGFFEALVHHTHDNDERTTRKYAFPSLRSLFYYLPDSFSCSDILQSTQPLILNTLNRRSDSGLGLHRLVVGTEDLQSKIMDKFREFVPNVENAADWKSPHSDSYTSSMKTYYHYLDNYDEMDALMGVWM